MRDLNEDSNSYGWPLYYGDKALTNGQYYNGYLPRVAADAYPKDDKDAVKRTMLEHEAIFKSQVNIISLSPTFILCKTAYLASSRCLLLVILVYIT